MPALTFPPFLMPWKNGGLTPGGRVQKAVDEAVIRYCDPKVPFRTGTLKHSAITASAIGDGMIVYATPYARYLYYGEVYGPNIPIFEGGELAGFFQPAPQVPHRPPADLQRRAGSGCLLV